MTDEQKRRQMKLVIALELGAGLLLYLGIKSDPMNSDSIFISHRVWKMRLRLSH